MEREPFFTFSFPSFRFNSTPTKLEQRELGEYSRLHPV